MSDYIGELVKRLDEHWGRRRIGDMSCLLADAADALEALAGEVERQRLLGVGAALECEEQKKRAQSAEAERDRMKAALVRLRDCDWVIRLPDRMDGVRQIAREALEGKE